jgi:hypothetical protein
MPLPKDLRREKAAIVNAQSLLAFAGEMSKWTYAGLLINARCSLVSTAFKINREALPERAFSHSTAD